MIPILRITPLAFCLCAVSLLEGMTNSTANGISKKTVSPEYLTVLTSRNPQIDAIVTSLKKEIGANSNFTNIMLNGLLIKGMAEKIAGGCGLTVLALSMNEEWPKQMSRTAAVDRIRAIFAIAQSSASKCMIILDNLPLFARNHQELEIFWQSVHQEILAACERRSSQYVVVAVAESIPRTIRDCKVAKLSPQFVKNFVQYKL